jgi:hypothetical protein
MERIGKKFHSFAEADEWNRQQYREMTQAERIACAEELQRRMPGQSLSDAMEWIRMQAGEIPYNSSRHIGE